MAGSCRPPGIRKLCPGFAAVGRPPRVVQRTTGAHTAHEHEAPVRQRDAAVPHPRCPPGTRVHLRPGRAVVGRSPHVVLKVIVARTAHEHDAPVRQHDAAVAASCRPPGTRVHLRPGCAVVGRPPHVVQIGAATHTAHEHDAPVRQRDAGVPHPRRPPGTRVRERPCRAVVGRPIHVVQWATVTPAREHDAAVRQRDAGVPHPRRPPGTRVHFRPRLIVRLVAEEPRPPGRIAGRGVGEGDSQGCEAGGRCAGEVCRRRIRDRDVIVPGECVFIGRVHDRQHDRVRAGDGIGVRGVPLCRIRGVEPRTVPKRPVPRRGRTGGGVGEGDGQGCEAGGRCAGEVCFWRNRNRDVIDLGRAVVAASVVRLQRDRVGARGSILVRGVLVHRPRGLEPPHVVQGRIGVHTAHEYDACVPRHDAGVAKSFRPPGIRKLRPGCAAVGRPPHVVQWATTVVLTAHDHDAPVRHHDTGVAISCRPFGIRQLRPCCASVVRPPHVVQGHTDAKTAYEQDAAVVQYDAGVIPPCRPPGTRVHLRPGFAAVVRSPHVVLKAIATLTAHEQDAAVVQHDAGVADSCQPFGMLVHFRPGYAVIVRPPHVVLEATTNTAHEQDAAVVQHDAGVFSWRPLDPLRYDLRPCRAVVDRQPHVVLVDGVVVHATHEYDAPVRHRDAGVPLSCRPPGTVVHRRPGIAVGLVAEEPRPPGRIAGRVVGKGDGQGCGAGDRRAAEVCFRRNHDCNVIIPGERVFTDRVRDRQPDRVVPDGGIGVRGVLLCRVRGVEPRTVAERPVPRRGRTGGSVGEGDGQGCEAGNRCAGEVCFRRLHNRDVIDLARTVVAAAVVRLQRDRVGARGVIDVRWVPVRRPRGLEPPHVV